MQEAQSMGMFDKNNQKEAADVYTKALQKVETEVSKSREKESSLIDTSGKGSQEEFKSKPKQEEDDLDDYADQRMDEMFNEENQEDHSEYRLEYIEVVSQINSLCNAISHNHKPTNRDNQLPVNEV